MNIDKFHFSTLFQINRFDFLVVVIYLLNVVSDAQAVDLPIELRDSKSVYETKFEKRNLKVFDKCPTSLV